MKRKNNHLTVIICLVFWNNKNIHLSNFNHSSTNFLLFLLTFCHTGARRFNTSMIKQDESVWYLGLHNTQMQVLSPDILENTKCSSHRHFKTSIGSLRRKNTCHSQRFSYQGRSFLLIIKESCFVVIFSAGVLTVSLRFSLRFSHWSHQRQRGLKTSNQTNWHSLCSTGKFLIWAVWETDFILSFPLIDGVKELKVNPLMPLKKNTLFELV